MNFEDLKGPNQVLSFPFVSRRNHLQGPRTTKYVSWNLNFDTWGWSDMRWLWWFTHSKCCWSFPNRCLSFWIKSGSCWNSILRVWKGFLGVNLTICCSIWDYVYIFCMVLFIFIRWQWGDYEKGQETTCLQNQEVKASRASPSPQRMPCLIHVPRAWAKSAPSHDSDNIFEIINEVAACLGWNGALRLLRFFFGGGDV